ncbi:MAG: hypothetical protein RR448_03745 [Niameybacter sp.]|uniref:hypothetical protein n=1 Tax=Niameybacter sp. TaxID=2033640 RepID=UPI002FCB355A
MEKSKEPRNSCITGAKKWDNDEYAILGVLYNQITKRKEQEEQVESKSMDSSLWEQTSNSNFMIGIIVVIAGFIVVYFVYKKNK